MTAWWKQDTPARSAARRLDPTPALSCIILFINLFPSACKNSLRRKWPLLKVVCALVYFVHLASSAQQPKMLAVSTTHKHTDKKKIKSRLAKNSKLRVKSKELADKHGRGDVSGGSSKNNHRRLQLHLFNFLPCCLVTCNAVPWPHRLLP